MSWAGCSFVGGRILMPMIGVSCLRLPRMRIRTVRSFIGRDVICARGTLQELPATSRMEFSCVSFHLRTALFALARSMMSKIFITHILRRKREPEALRWGLCSEVVKFVT